MEDRSTTTSATTALQGANENHGNDREIHVMEDRATTTSATTPPHGGMQLGNNNSITYKNCAIYYITNNCKQCHPAEEHVVSEDTPRDLTPSSYVRTTTRVRLVDCEGRELELGDVVMAGWKCAIYTGDGMIIGVNEETGKIVHEPINVEKPFSSMSLLKMRLKYSPIQIVQRARGKIGQMYDDEPFSFVVWCYTGMTREECLLRRRRILRRKIKLLDRSTTLE